MPTINFSLNDLSKLAGKKISLEELESYAHLGKGELEGYDKATDEATVAFDDTNLPYLWSAEGFARLIKLYNSRKGGLQKLKVMKSDYEVIVDSSVMAIRPHFAAFVAKGRAVDDYLIKQLVQLQEKFCESYGRKRQKVSIGIYSYKKIKFPLHYGAVEPESVSFVPLDHSRKMSLREILQNHPKGKQYAWILEGEKKYPIFMDDKNQVLSFPPIINSATTGKIEPGEEELLVEITGTDEESVNLAANIFAFAMADRGFGVYSVKVKYPTRNITTPKNFDAKIRISREQVKAILGIELSAKQTRQLAERAGFGFSNFTINIPDYRRDILHPFDVIEDIGIVYGYERLGEQALETYTAGKTFEAVNFIDNVRELMVGNGYQEIMSPILTNKGFLYDRMGINDTGTVEIKNYVSETYSAVRSWLLPTLLEVLSKNKHENYPQKVFEQGLVTVRKGDKAVDCEKLSVITTHKDADYTELKQALDNLMASLGVEYSVKETEHNSFIPGRVANILVKGKNIGLIGEIHPKVLSNWQLGMPVSGFEINLSELFQVLEK